MSANSAELELDGLLSDAWKVIQAYLDWGGFVPREMGAEFNRVEEYFKGV